MSLILLFIVGARGFWDTPTMCAGGLDGSHDADLNLLIVTNTAAGVRAGGLNSLKGGLNSFNRSFRHSLGHPSFDFLESGFYTGYTSSSPLNGSIWVFNDPELSSWPLRDIESSQAGMAILSGCQSTICSKDFTLYIWSDSECISIDMPSDYSPSLVSFCVCCP